MFSNFYRFVNYVFVGANLALELHFGDFGLDREQVAAGWAEHQHFESVGFRLKITKMVGIPEKVSSFTKKMGKFYEQACILEHFWTFLKTFCKFLGYFKFCSGL